MPSKKKPNSLETSSLEIIGEKIFLATVTNVTSNLLYQYVIDRHFGDVFLFGSKVSSNELKEILSENGINELRLHNMDTWKKNKQNKVSFKIRAMQMIEDTILQLQQSFFVETAHYFHSSVALQCMVILLK